MRWMALVLLAACTQKAPEGDFGDTPLGDTDTDTDTEAVTEDTGGGDAPDPAATPTDVDEACWAWMVQDDGPDGDADVAALYVYEPTMILLTAYELDFDLDGEMDLARRYEYDAAGLLTGSYDDDDGDGDYELVELIAYDANGDPTRYTIDEEGDGTIEESWSFVYVDGLRRSLDVDYGDDGAIDVRYEYWYDDVDRLITAVGDEGLDGTIDLSATYDYVGPTGLDRTTEVDRDGDGVIDEVGTSRYDAAGNTLFLDEDYITEGWRGVSTYTYRADGTQEAWSFVYSEGGIPVYDLVETSTWLAPEMRDSVTRVHGLNELGFEDYVRTYTWSCDR